MIRGTGQELGPPTFMCPRLTEGITSQHEAANTLYLPASTDCQSF